MGLKATYLNEAKLAAGSFERSFGKTIIYVRAPPSLHETPYMKRQD